jgi:hypothetical protein
MAIYLKEIYHKSVLHGRRKRGAPGNMTTTPIMSNNKNNQSLSKSMDNRAKSQRLQSETNNMFSLVDTLEKIPCSFVYVGNLKSRTTKCELEDEFCMFRVPNTVWVA